MNKKENQTNANTIQYSQARNYLKNQLRENHWKFSQEIIWKWMKENQLQRNIRQFVSRIQSHFKTDGKVWEAWQLNQSAQPTQKQKHQSFAIVSIQNEWRIVSEQDNNHHPIVVAEGNVETDSILHIQLEFIYNHFHVFIVDQQGSVHYLVFDQQFQLVGSILRYRHEGIGREDKIKEIIPIYADKKNISAVHYLWAVYESRIALLHVSRSEKFIKSVVFYSVPSRSNLINSEGCNTIHFRNGLLGLHYSSPSMKGIQLQILDSTPAILFNEKPHTERRRTFESLKFPIILESVFHTAYRSGGSTEEIVFSSISSVVPDSCPNYSSTGESISNLPFSIQCYIVGSKSSISVLSYKSAEYAVKTMILQLTGRYLLDFEMMSRNDKLFSVEPIQTISYLSAEGPSHQKNLADPTEERKQRKVTVWEACALLQISIPVRRAWLVDLWKDAEYDLVTPQVQPAGGLSAFDKSSIDQTVLLEGVLGLGLTKCLHEAILKIDDENYRSKYFMEESQKLFHWIAGQGLQQGKLPSLREHLGSLLFPLLTDRIFVYLSKKNQADCFYQQIPLTVSLDLSNVSQLTSTYRVLSKALYERKIALTTETLKLSNSDLLLNTALSDDLESAALMELSLISFEATLLQELVAFYQLLCEDEFTQLSEFFPFGSGSGNLKKANLNELQAYLQHMFQASSLQNDLPDSEYRGDYLFYELIDRLNSNVYDSKVKGWFEGLLHERSARKASDEEQYLGTVFALPYLLVRQTSQTILLGLQYFKKSLLEMHELIARQALTAKYVLIFIVLLIRSLSQTSTASDVIKQHTDSRFCGLIATALQVTPFEVNILEALRVADANSDEIQLTSAIATLSSSLAIEFLTKHDLIEPVIKRLLFSGKIMSSYRLLQALLSLKHPFTQSKKGVVAFALSIPHHETWELHWQQARSLCDRLSPADGLEAISQITFYLCRWCMRVKSESFQPLGTLLNKDLNYAESEQIIKFLLEYVNYDIKQKVSPSPAVDTLFGLFIKLLRVDEARALHETHAIATRQNTGIEAIQSINYRNKILQLSLLCPRISPIDYQLVLNMNRINQISYR